MKARQRIITALNHQQPDRLPLDCGSVRSAGITAVAYANLKQLLGINRGHTYIYDMEQQLALVEPCIAEALGIDVLNIECGFISDDYLWKEWQLADGTNVLIPFFINIKEQAGNQYFCYKQGQHLSVIEEDSFFPKNLNVYEGCDISTLINADPNWVEKQLWYGNHRGLPTLQEYFLMNDRLDKQADKELSRFYRSTDNAIVATFGGSLFQVPQYLCGHENYLEYMLIKPDVIGQLSLVLTEIYLNQLEPFLSSVGDYIDVVVFEDDFGFQRGPLISPDMYRRFFKPFHQRMWQRVKDLCNAKIMLHSCGSVAVLLPDMLDAGLDIIHPVQLAAEGMEPEKLKNQFGERLCFWGGGYDDPVFIKGSKEPNSRENWQRQVDILKKGSGFVCQPLSNILPQHDPRLILDLYTTLAK